MYINNCKFFENFGLNGGLFFAHYSSYIEVINSEIANNSAFSSSLVEVENDAYFVFKNTSISENSAFSDNLVSISDSLSRNSTFENCLFNNN